jgi:hypothetical protein
MVDGGTIMDGVIGKPKTKKPINRNQLVPFFA